jgi:hypothetical protein
VVPPCEAVRTRAATPGLRAVDVIVLSFRDVFSMVSSQVLLEVVPPCEAVRTRAATPGLRAVDVIVLSFREVLSMVSSQVLLEVVPPCEAVRTRAATPGPRAVDVLLLMCRFDVSGEVCFAAERAEISAVLVNAVAVGTVLFFLRISISTSMGFVNQSANGRDE